MSGSMVKGFAAFRQEDALSEMNGPWVDLRLLPRRRGLSQALGLTAHQPMTGDFVEWVLLRAHPV